MAGANGLLMFSETLRFSPAFGLQQDEVAFKSITRPFARMRAIGDSRDLPASAVQELVNQTLLLVSLRAVDDSVAIPQLLVNGLCDEGLQ